MSTSSQLSISTIAIHGDSKYHEKREHNSTLDTPLSPMISTATTFNMNISSASNYIYVRHNQPTRSKLEYLFTKIHNGTSSIIYPSGVSAIRSLFEYYKPKRLFLNNGYKGTVKAIKDISSMEIILLKNEQINIEYFENNISPKLSSNDIILLESPSNPYLNIFDIQPLAKYIHKYGAKIIIDSTIATPIILQLFKYDIDIIIESCTKFIGGHSDICAGVIIFNNNINPNLCGDSIKMHNIRTLHGNLLGNLETWLLLRSIRSLSSRIKIQSINSCKIAKFLSNDNNKKYFESIYHTSLKSHPNHDLALKYFERDNLYFNNNNINDDDDKKSENDNGMILHPGLICIVASTEKIAKSIIKKFELIIYCTSFGGVETTIDLRSKFDHNMAQISNEISKS